jgi:antitoxin component YwqK of YwqJK toxin-antitoxin module
LKPIAIILTVILAFVSCSKKKETDNERVVQGVAYEITEKDPPTDYNGVWTYYHENGKKECEETYVNGKLNGPVTVWREDGSVHVKVGYKDNWRHGKMERWFEDGQKESEENFLNGNFDGKQTYWHKNGQKESERCYDNAKETGTWIYYGQEGTVIKKERYEKGNLLETEEISSDEKVEATKALPPQPNNRRTIHE